MAVMEAESGCRKDAVNLNDNHGKCLGSFSLMQVACFWYSKFGYAPADYHKPEVNIEIAYKIWQWRKQGFTPWPTYTSGAYLKYLR